MSGARAGLGDVVANRRSGQVRALGELVVAEPAGLLEPLQQRAQLASAAAPQLRERHRHSLPASAEPAVSPVAAHRPSTVHPCSVHGGSADSRRAAVPTLAHAPDRPSPRSPRRLSGSPRPLPALCRPGACPPWSVSPPCSRPPRSWSRRSSDCAPATGSPAARTPCASSRSRTSPTSTASRNDSHAGPRAAPRQAPTR